MPELTLTELVAQSQIKAQNAFRLFESITDPKAREAKVIEFASHIKLLNEMMSTKGSYRGPKISMEEALKAPDMSILFPKVISDVLMRPKEPLMIGQTLLAKTVMVDNVRSVEFPVLGAIRAFDMSETQEYREQLASVGEHFTEVKTTKVGLGLAISEEVVRDSMWDVLALYMEAAGYAMLRKKEEKIFNEFKAHGHVVFDNGAAPQTGSSYANNQYTRGRALTASGTLTPNYTVTFDDFIDTMGGLIANEYIPTDVLMHPLAWVIFMKDPIIRNVFYTQGQLGATVWTQIPDFDQQMNLPWNVNYQVTPFMPFQPGVQLPAGSSGASLPATNITDLYVIDRQNACVVLQRDPMEIDQFDDPRRDIQFAKLRERYGVGTLNGGRAIAAIKNIRLERNDAPAYNVGNVVPS